MDSFALTFDLVNYTVGPHASHFIANVYCIVYRLHIQRNYARNASRQLPMSQCHSDENQEAQ